MATAIAALFSFTPKNYEPKTANLAGKYGAFCNETDPLAVGSLLLVLNDDNTFQYNDNSVANAKISVSGKWSIYEGDVYLSDYGTGNHIPRIWKTDKDSPCLKARKGTMFLRLCKQ